MPDDESYLSISATCALFSFCRATFYNMLADPRSGLKEIVVRIPPETGRIRIPRVAFEKWLRERRQGRRS